MTHKPPERVKKSFWLRARPYLILVTAILALEFAVAYYLDWSLFHETEVELSELEDQGKCFNFTVNNLLQEERVLEEPSLSLLAFNSDSISRSRPIPLKLEGTSDDKIVLRPGDQRKLCATFASDMLKQNIIYRIQDMDEPDKIRCKFHVVVRKPNRTHTHVYAQVFNCADRLTSLYQ